MSGPSSRHQSDATVPDTPSDTYVALLRGINVGGKNVIRMAELRSCFEATGFRDVITYIQSGNVIFRAPASALGPLTIRIEEMLASAFNYRARVVLRSREQMDAVVAGAPAGFGSRPRSVSLRHHFCKGSPHGDRRHGGGSDPARRRRGLGRQRGSLFLATDQQSLPELPQPTRLDARVPGHDDPELEHDDQTAAAHVLS